MLGNDKLWGYDKKDCVLTINEAEAQVVRRIFHLYANEQIGIRRISRQLYDEGFTSRKGNAFNVLTIRHILENPKYKGWYCANKSQTVDYRSKRKIFLDESEWVMYPDPSIPAIVSEELWDRANALYKQRSAQMMVHQSAAGFHNRYPYSGKIFCEEHGASFHRQVLKSAKGEKEVWQCRVYRNRGRAGCSAPQMRSSELDLILAQIFHELAQDRQAIVNAGAECHPGRSAGTRLPTGRRARGSGHFRCLRQKGSPARDEHRGRPLGGGVQTAQRCLQLSAPELELQREAVKMEEEKSWISVEQLQKIQAALEEELSFRNGVSSALVATILDRIVVKKNSTREEIYLDIYLKFGAPCVVRIDREKDSFCFLPSKSTIPAPAIRMISFQSVPLASSRLSIPSIRKKTSSFRLMQPDVSKMKS